MSYSCTYRTNDRRTHAMNMVSEAFLVELSDFCSSVMVSPVIDNAFV